MKRLLTLFCLLNALVARADSVILVIGDGMGFEAMKRAQDGGGPWSAFPYFTAIETTNPFCGVPDSASTATAIATGIFTENGMLAVMPDGAKLHTLAEEARDRGLRVGMFTNDEITGATPAAFYAHQPSRRAMPEIAVDLLRSGFSLFMGAGAPGSRPTRRARRLCLENGYRSPSEPAHCGPLVESRNARPHAQSRHRPSASPGAGGR